MCTFEIDDVRVYLFIKACIINKCEGQIKKKLNT